MRTVSAAALLLFFAGALSGCEEKAVPQYSDQVREARGFFALVGDTQRTTAIEEGILRREQNDPERECVAAGLLRERPDFAVLAGDLVSWNNDSNWKVFDRLFHPYIAAGVSLLPVLGNHDYWGGNTPLLARFARLRQSHWYGITYRGIRLLFLDSNLDRLSKRDRENQRNWLKRELEDAGRTSAIKLVAVVAHHPFYSNSTVTGDEPEVQEEFLPLLGTAPKWGLYLSGHAHAYEKFKESGRIFVVSGGGGGPRVKLLEGQDARHTDLFTGLSPRPFHFLVLEPAADALRIRMLGFAKGECVARELDSFSIAYQR